MLVDRCFASFGPPGSNGVKLSVVDHRVSGHGRAGRLAVGKRAGHGHRRLGVLHLAELIPDLTACGGAELVLQRVQVFGAPHLVAAGDAEDPSDQRGRGDEVVAVPRRDLQAGLLDVGVHARDERVDVRDDRPSLRALALRGPGTGRRGSPRPFWLGMKTRPDRARLNASTPGTSRAAMREGPRTSRIKGSRPRAVTKPDPNITSRAGLARDVCDAPLVPDNLQLPSGRCPRRAALSPGARTSRA